MHNVCIDFIMHFLRYEFLTLCIPYIIHFLHYAFLILYISYIMHFLHHTSRILRSYSGYKICTSNQSSMHNIRRDLSSITKKLTKPYHFVSKLSGWHAELKFDQLTEATMGLSRHVWIKIILVQARVHKITFCQR